jgi:hypothetical protein
MQMPMAHPDIHFVRSGVECRPERFEAMAKAPCLVNKTIVSSPSCPPSHQPSNILFLPSMNAEVTPAHMPNEYIDHEVSLCETASHTLDTWGSTMATFDSPADHSDVFTRNNSSTADEQAYSDCQLHFQATPFQHAHVGHDPSEPRSIGKLEFNGLEHLSNSLSPAVYHLSPGWRSNYTCEAGSVYTHSHNGDVLYSNLPYTYDHATYAEHIEVGNLLNSSSLGPTPYGNQGDKKSNVLLSGVCNQDSKASLDGSNLEKGDSYAKQLEQCLKSVPDYTMVLKDIYTWFQKNTERSKDPKSRGWQNSIRHNLSMNKVEDIPSHDLWLY